MVSKAISHRDKEDDNPFNDCYQISTTSDIQEWLPQQSLQDLKKFGELLQRNYHLELQSLSLQKTHSLAPIIEAIEYHARESTQ